MILWTHHTISDSLIMLHGFKEDDARSYAAVMTLENKKYYLCAYGFMSHNKILLGRDMLAMFRYIQNTFFDHAHIYFEVLPEHRAVYEKYLNIESVRESKTFNGLNSWTLSVRIKDGIK